MSYVNRYNSSGDSVSFVKLRFREWYVLCKYMVQKILQDSVSYIKLYKAKV